MSPFSTYRSGRRGRGRDAQRKHRPLAVEKDSPQSRFAQNSKETGYIRKSGFQISLLSKIDENYLLGVYFGGNSAKERNNKIHFLMNKYQNKKAINKNTYNSSNTSNDYIVETSTFKKISDSKKHISYIQKKMFFLRDHYHHIKKRGKFFVSFY